MRPSVIIWAYWKELIVIEETAELLPVVAVIVE